MRVGLVLLAGAALLLTVRAHWRAPYPVEAILAENEREIERLRAEHLAAEAVRTPVGVPTADGDARERMDRLLREIDLQEGERDTLRWLDGGRWSGRPERGASHAPPRATSLRVDAVSVRFFESGRGTPPVAQRVHRTRFARASARYVNWELALAHSPPGGRVEFPIEARWYKPDGSVLAVQTLRTHVEATWADSSHTFGRGSPDPGTWAPGWHHVDFHVGGTVVARASFEILP